MSAVIGSLLPLGLGVAISPIPIIAIILMLLAPRAGATSLGFAMGWVAGIVVGTSVFALVGGAAGGPSTTAAWIQLVLGLLALVLAVRNWRSRPRPGRPATLPGWLAAIDTMTPGKGAGLGFALSALNPKNLALLAGAGVDLGAADLPFGALIVVLVCFTVLASCTVLLPVIVYRLAGARVEGSLRELKAWLEAHNNAVMVVLLAVLGTVLVGKGLGALLA